MSKKIIQRGWHFLQIPGPSNTPARVLQAMAKPTIDHRGPEFGILTKKILNQLKKVFKTNSPVIIYPSSGTGAWEAALINLFSPGDKVVGFESGYFAELWKNVAIKTGLSVEWVSSDWRHGADPKAIAKILMEDENFLIKGVMVVHNETSTGITSDILSIRQAIDQAKHPALLLVDVVSSLVTDSFEMDAWGVDVAICASQKGLMLPPGLGFNAISNKAIAMSQRNQSLHSYWRWDRIIEMNQTGYFPYTPASGLLFGLDESLKMIDEEGLDNIIHRHRRLASAARVAADAWGLENQCANPNEYSNSTTALILPDGFNGDELREVILDNYNLTLGSGLGKLKSKIFRIGHLGDFNELMLMATLSGIEMGMALQKIPFKKGGTLAAMDFLTHSTP